MGSFPSAGFRLIGASLHAQHGSPTAEAMSQLRSRTPARATVHPPAGQPCLPGGLAGHSHFLFPNLSAHSGCGDRHPHRHRNEALAERREACGCKLCDVPQFPPSKIAPRCTLLLDACPVAVWKAGRTPGKRVRRSQKNPERCDGMQSKNDQQGKKTEENRKYKMPPHTPIPPETEETPSPVGGGKPA